MLFWICNVLLYVPQLIKVRSGNPIRHFLFWCSAPQTNIIWPLDHFAAGWAKVVYIVVSFVGVFCTSQLPAIPRAWYRRQVLFLKRGFTMDEEFGGWREQRLVTSGQLTGSEMSRHKGLKILIHEKSRQKSYDGMTCSGKKGSEIWLQN